MRESTGRNRSNGNNIQSVITFSISLGPGCKLTVFQENTQATLSHSVPLATLQSSRFAMALAIESTLSRTSATLYVWPVNPQVYGLRDSSNDLRPCFSEYMNSSTVMLSGRGTEGRARAQAGDSKTMIAFCWAIGMIGKTKI